MQSVLALFYYDKSNIVFLLFSPRIRLIQNEWINVSLQNASNIKREKVITVCLEVVDNNSAQSQF